MGQYHYLINLDKKQIINPNQIGNGLKLKEQIGWEYATATVLVMLLAASNKDGARGGATSIRAIHSSGAGRGIALLSWVIMLHQTISPVLTPRSFTSSVKQPVTPTQKASDRPAGKNGPISRLKSVK